MVVVEEEAPGCMEVEGRKEGEEEVGAVEGLFFEEEEEEGGGRC